MEVSPSWKSLSKQIFELRIAGEAWTIVVRAYHYGRRCPKDKAEISY
jgi:hypothetical protein